MNPDGVDRETVVVTDGALPLKSVASLNPGNRMVITETVNARNRRAWRSWLKKHYRNEKEVWLIYYRRHSGRTRISYNDAVEEALCFGWIDSTVKKIDGERIAQKFSPRRPTSKYSQANRERLRRLVKQGKVMKEIRADLGKILTKTFKVPADILSALKGNKKAWRNFRRYSEPYQRIRIGFVDSARNRPAEFAKRLKHLVRMTEKDKQYGYGIETYY